MKYIFFASVAVLILASAGMAAEKNKPNFDSIKKKELNMISLQLQALTKKQGCVSNATNGNDIKNCNQEFHYSIKQQRIIQIEEQQKTLEQRKQQQQQQ